MNYNKQRFLAVFSLIAILTNSTYAQDENMYNSTVIEQAHNQKWYNYLYQHLQLAYGCDFIMYGDNFANSCINHLGHNNKSYSMSGSKLYWEVKYNVFEHNQWSLYAGVGYVTSSMDFKNDFVYLEENGSIGTFVHTSNPICIANIESKQPSDFGLGHKAWNSSINTDYITFPIAVSYGNDNVEYGFTILPSIRVGNTALSRSISIGCGEDSETLHWSNDNRLDKYFNKFGCTLRFCCLYLGWMGGYVEFGTMSMTKNLKYDMYSFSIGIHSQLTFKNFCK